MDHGSPAPRRGAWFSAAGRALGPAACVAAVWAVGWAVAQYHGGPRAGAFVPWCVGLALAGALALLAPRAWLDRWLAARHRHLAAAVLLIAFLAVEVTMAWFGYLTFRHYSGDLHLLGDIVQETLRGGFFALPVEADSYLGQFWIPQIALWLPFWAAWPDPRVLLLFQIGSYWAMALVVYRLAVLRLGAGPWPLALLTAVLLAPTKDWTLSMALGNAPLLAFLIALAALCVHRGRPVGFVFATVAVLVSREFGAALAGALALYAWWHRRWRGLALALGIGAALWLVALVAVIMPWLAPERGNASLRVFGLGGSILEAGTAAATQTGRLLSSVLAESVEGLLGILTPFGLLPALGMEAWMLLPGLAPNLLAGGYRSRLAYHHAYMGIAIAAVIAIEGARWLDRLLPATRAAGRRARLAALLSVPVTALVLHVTIGYSPLASSFRWDEYRQTPRTRALWAALRQVPAGVELTSSRHLGAQRAVGRRLGCTWERVSLRERDGRATLWCQESDAPLESPFVLIDRPRPSPTLDHLVRRSPYGVVLDAADVVLLQHGADRRLTRWLVGDVAEPIRLPRQIGTVVRDKTARGAWAVRAPRSEAGMLLHGWSAAYCPGPYELTAHLRLDRTRRPGPLGRLEVATDAGRRVLATRSIELADLASTEYRELTLAFIVAAPLQAEMRIFSTGAAAFRVDGLSVVALDPRTGDPRPPREACGRDSPSGTVPG